MTPPHVPSVDPVEEARTLRLENDRLRQHNTRLQTEGDAGRFRAAFAEYHRAFDLEKKYPGTVAKALAKLEMRVGEISATNAALLQEREEQGRRLADYERVAEASLEETPQGPVVWLRVGGEHFGFNSAQVPNILEYLRSRIQGEATTDPCEVDWDGVGSRAQGGGE